MAGPLPERRFIGFVSVPITENKVRKFSGGELRGKNETMSTNRTISGFFEKDHDEIDAILAAADFSDPAAALPRLREFDRRLERHIAWEEESLFPAAARADQGMTGGPVAVMKMEHAAIRKTKTQALERLAAGDAAGARVAVDEMLSILTSHNMKEEQILYPACDQILAATEVSRLIDLFTASGGSV